MPPRVAIWSASFAFGMEAIANEVEILSDHLPESCVWGINPRKKWIYKYRKRFACDVKYQLIFRLWVKLFQRKYQVQHLYGSLGDWFHLRALNQQPAVLTVALDLDCSDLTLLEKINHFAVEWPSAIQKLIALGIPEHKISLVLPPVDLDKFKPIAPPRGNFIATFASSPEKIEALDARGVPLMLDAAKLRPCTDFTLVWRPWGQALTEVQNQIKSRDLKNVRLHTSKIQNMECVYQDAHVTLACFSDMSQCKSMPNSIIESLACGRPVIITHQVELASMVAEANAGIIIQNDPAQLANALETIQNDWQRYSDNARRLAQTKFCQKRFIQQYLEIYKNLLIKS